MDQKEAEGEMGQKKSPFDGMSKNDLVKKCKGLLMIIQKFKQNKEELIEENTSLKETIASFEEQKSADKTSLKTMQEFVDNLTEHKLQATSQVQALEQTIKSLRQQVKSTENMDQLLTENESFKRQVKRISDENDELMQEINNLESKLAEVNRIGEEQKLHFVKLEESTKKFLSMEDNYQRACKTIEGLQEDKTVMRDKLKTYKSKILEIANKFQKLKFSHKVTLQVVQDYSRSIPNWQRELRVVLGVMNESLAENNQLKIKISDLELKLQTENESSEVEKPNSDENSVSDEESKLLQDLQSQVNSNRKIISKIEAEKVEILEEKSKIEIIARDMENKVKAIKQENSDLLQEMKDLNEILKERGEVISKQQSEMSNLEVQTTELQESMDKIQNILQEKDQTINKLIEENKIKPSSGNDETMSTSTISKLDESTKTEEFEEKYYKVKEVAMKLKKRLDEETKRLKSLQEESTIKTNEIESLQKKLTINESEIKTQQSKEQQLIVELEKTKTLAKKSNVLSLEMDAYEKSMEETVKKLKQKQDIIVELEQTIQDQTSTINSLKVQTKLVEDRIESETKHGQELVSSIAKFQTRIKELESEKSDFLNRLEKGKREESALRSEIEELKLETVQKHQETESLAGSLQMDRDNLSRTNFELESRVRGLITQLKDKEDVLEKLEKEFSNYKIRAHTILQQNQTQVNSRELELEEEVKNLRQMISNSEQKDKSTASVILDLENTVNTLNSESERNAKKNQELLTILDETKLINQQLIQEKSDQMERHQEILKTQKLNIDTLKNCYKKQVEELEQKLERITIENSLNQREDRSKLHSSTDEEKIQEMHLNFDRREDGEGSESASSYIQLPPKRKLSRKTSRNSNPGFIPLEDLLNSNLEDSVDSQTMDPVSVEDEKKHLLEQCHAKERQNRHLTTLLAEAEQDVAKLNQLNDVLKEEVRRQEKNVEREAHLHNSEYIKNVIFKFLTLNSGDEKSHLVPVLNTILKLTPDERHKLQNAAKGQGIDNAKGFLGQFLPFK